jgi:hypothetical protein
LGGLTGPVRQAADLPGAERVGVLSALLARTAEGWQLFVRGDEARQADAFLIGPSGLFAVLIGEQPPDPAVAHEMMRHAEEQCADIFEARAGRCWRRAFGMWPSFPVAAPETSNTAGGTGC